jgi:hypothetical protein
MVETQVCEFDTTAVLAAAAAVAHKCSSQLHWAG